MFLLLPNIVFTVANTGMRLWMALKVKYALTSVISLGCMDDWIYSCVPLFTFSCNTNTNNTYSSPHECEFFLMTIVYLYIMCRILTLCFAPVIGFLLDN